MSDRADAAVTLANVGKMFRLYGRPRDRLLDAFGLGRLCGVAAREFWALRGVELRIARGERVGIVGANGAGKSTLLKLVTGNAAPTEGSVRTAGRVHALIELGTGFHPEFTGRENVRAALALEGIGRRELPALEREIEEFAELDAFIDRPVRTYSTGMYARLAFAAATAARPDLVVIDEIFGAGDVYFAGKCVERLRAMTTDRGATVLFVSHDFSAVGALCDRTVWIDRGRVVADGPTLDVVRAYAASARREEERRLAARARRLTKRSAAALAAAAGSTPPLLFRLVAANPAPPSGEARIRSLALRSGAGLLAGIAVGGPADNAPDAANRILDDPGYMDWGAAERDADGFYRAVRPGAGRFAHAPFVFALPGPPPADAILAVRSCGRRGPGTPTPGSGADATDGSAGLAVERFDEVAGTYVRLGRLSDGESTFALPAAAPAPPPPAAAPSAPAPVEEYGSGEAWLTAVRLLDAESRDTGTLFTGEPFRIELSFETATPLRDPVFAFCIYLPTGQCACQWLVSAAELGRGEIVRGGTVAFAGDRLLLGRGAYVASAAIFKTRPVAGVEPESWHVLDRTIRFRADDRLPVDRVDYGICRQPVKAELDGG